MGAAPLGELAPPGNDRDLQFMRRALEVAERGAGQVAPNPKVGAVVVQDERVIAEGWHPRYGDEHAEAMALRIAGERARGTTVYVTLEPCNHHGKTPPCAAALIAAGVTRVVYAVADPDDVARGGASVLAAAGIDVHAGVLAVEASEVNAPFLFAASGATRPFVTLKLAISIDGAIVGASRARTQLTGAESRAAVHRLRADADAIAVGAETALQDDPELTVRDAPAPRVAPARVVFDRAARLRLESVMVRTARDVPVLLVTDGRRPEAEARLARQGVTVIQAGGLPDALVQLRRHGIRHLLVEGGASLAAALVTAGLVDRLITFQAPVILGSGALPAFAGLSSPLRLSLVSRREYGPDLMSVFRFDGISSDVAGL
ncbi:MAG TPA: bifunctional diaminohydroxyphosphoribosylaminopyrimidine deaminase/5-amino-6-(5-phosphoribosylamino)uracil reductase RibD [Gemmatimonas sp.]|nr:bifunctional diaminohydroxyphosphoribosylaminopyrimidine deaminase/5-amino-6-(5-phosphoribosylamino)uracil reductase RibD [Gemmatimonas sp.]